MGRDIHSCFGSHLMTLELKAWPCRPPTLLRLAKPVLCARFRLKCLVEETWSCNGDLAKALRKKLPRGSASKRRCQRSICRVLWNRFLELCCRNASFSDY